MNRTTNIAMTLLLGVLFCPLSAMADCDERNGANFLQRGDLDSAFEMLQGCERKETVSPQTLMHLAKLYGSLDYAEMSEKDAMIKVWSLIHRAAELGHQNALANLIHLYTHGEPSIFVRPNEAKKVCLERASSSGEKIGDKIRACLAT